MDEDEFRPYVMIQQLGLLTAKLAIFHPYNQLLFQAHPSESSWESMKLAVRGACCYHRFFYPEEDILLVERKSIMQRFIFLSPLPLETLFIGDF